MPIERILRIHRSLLSEASVALYRGISDGQTCARGLSTYSEPRRKAIHTPNLRFRERWSFRIIGTSVKRMIVSVMKSDIDKAYIMGNVLMYFMINSFDVVVLQCARKLLRQAKNVAEGEAKVPNNDDYDHGVDNDT